MAGIVSDEVWNLISNGSDNILTVPAPNLKSRILSSISILNKDLCPFAYNFYLYHEGPLLL